MYMFFIKSGASVWPQIRPETQPLTMAAVEVKAGYKYYGNSVDPNKKIVLNYLNMNVMNGSMYVRLRLCQCPCVRDQHCGRFLV